MVLELQSQLQAKKTLLIERRSLKFAEHSKPEEIEKGLAGIPPSHRHSAEFTAKMLKYLIRKYKNKTN